MNNEMSIDSYYSCVLIQPYGYIDWYPLPVHPPSFDTMPWGFGLKLANNFWPGFLQPTPMLLQLCKVRRCGYTKPAVVMEFKAIRFSKCARNVWRDFKTDGSRWILMNQSSNILRGYLADGEQMPGLSAEDRQIMENQIRNLREGGRCCCVSTHVQTNRCNHPCILV